MTAFKIPLEYQKMSVKKAASLVGIPRTSFIRKYLEKGKISVQKAHDGSDFILFDELYRLFGETLAQNVLSEISGQGGQVSGQGVHGHFGRNGHPPMGVQNNLDRVVDIDRVHELELELVRLQGDKMRLEALLEERTRLAEERQSIIQEQKNQINRFFEELQVTRRILEDKKLNESKDLNLSNTKFSPNEPRSPLEQPTEGVSSTLSNHADQTVQPNTDKPKSFWAKLFGK